MLIIIKINLLNNNIDNNIFYLILFYENICICTYTKNKNINY